MSAFLSLLIADSLHEFQGSNPRRSSSARVKCIFSFPRARPALRNVKVAPPRHPSSPPLSLANQKVRWRITPTRLSPVVIPPSHKQIPLDTHGSLSRMSSHPCRGRATSTTAKGLLFHSTQGKVAVLSLAPKAALQTAQPQLRMLALKQEHAPAPPRIIFGSFCSPLE